MNADTFLDSFSSKASKGKQNGNLHSLTSTEDENSDNALESSESDAEQQKPVSSSKDVEKSSTSKNTSNTDALYKSFESTRTNKSTRRSQASNNEYGESAMNRLDSFLKENKDAVDLNLLLEAVNELEQEEDFSSGNVTFVKGQSQRGNNVTKLSNSDVSKSSSKRSNYSFKNNHSITVEAENQRLLKRIMAVSLAKKKSSNVATVLSREHLQRRLTSSALRRKREQQQIDQANAALLKRISSAKSTKSIRCDELVMQHNRQKSYSRPSSSPSASHVRSSSQRPPTSAARGYYTSRPSTAAAGSNSRPNSQLGMRPLSPL